LNSKIYSAVRKVNNKNSRNVPHSSGYFYSFKMKSEIPYESLSECYFYYFLDSNPLVKTFHPQPLKVAVPFLNEEGDVDYWEHVPDVLVFWESEESIPTLYQVKYEEKLDDRKQQLSDKECVKYCEKNNWKYEVVEIVKVDKTVIKNLKFLHGFIKNKQFYKDTSPLIEELMYTYGEMSIDNICVKLQEDYNELYLLPTIYYLVATGKLTINLFELIGRNSQVSKGSLISQLETNLKEVINSENYIIENKC